MTEPPRGPIRVVIAEDSILLREGLVRLLGEAGFDVVGAVGSGEELLRIAGAVRPDVAIVDIRMPPTHTDEGLRAAAALRARYGDAIGVLVLSQYVEVAYADQLIESDARGTGYLLKDRVADVAEIADAVRRVARGGSVIDPSLVAQLLRRRRRPDPLIDLTERETEVLGLMAEGRSNAAIAERLVISMKTIETHIASIFSKLGLEPEPDDHRRVLAVLAYLRRG
jgi:DNA-binding NarL/FixJ family response regulator